MARRTLIWGAGTAIAVALAAVGVFLYALDPGVGTYSANTLLISPLVGIVLYALHRALPMRVQWILAILIAPLGAIAYLLWPNDQWWNYGVLTAVPLSLLAWSRTQSEREPWYGGPADGPWGPP